ncbi:MAG: BCCT family transporter [Candidatus Tectomicrobia bacterium]|nr:BCCT family transporter [Candidatus Tectomicrobia bacterium]
MVSDPIPTHRPQARSYLFVIALPICVVVALWGIVDPDALVRAADAITTTIFRALDWFYLSLILFFLGLSVWLALSPYSRVISSSAG